MNILFHSNIYNYTFLLFRKYINLFQACTSNLPKLNLWECGQQVMSSICTLYTGITEWQVLKIIKLFYSEVIWNYWGIILKGVSYIKPVEQIKSSKKFPVKIKKIWKWMQKYFSFISLMLHLFLSRERERQSVIWRNYLDHYYKSFLIEPSTHNLACHLLLIPTRFNV